ncbi:MAG: ABC transporter substrate-binding protein [Proteobacteria bacterium]|nr:ABC transporter substrate-binding protein [Pseudomonadota bacterium]MDA1059438.1 ABC transporter substrate-binding protein [Pseudomonadota bacterium]
MKKLLIAAVLATTALVPFAAQAQMKDSVTLGMQLEPSPGLDPSQGAAAAISQVTWYNIFEGLTRINEAGEIGPMLADSWTISPDAKTYTFKLAKGVKFHDGADFTASDVKFTIDAATAEKSGNKNKKMYSTIKSIETPDDHTVILSLEAPSALFLFKSAQSTGAMVDPASAATNMTDPVGTGPYKFVRWTKGDSVEMELFPQHRNAANIKIKKAKFRFINDANAQVNALLSGDLDYMTALTAAQMFTQFKNNPDFTALEGTTEGETILTMNNKSGALSDVRVRRALMHAIDRQALVDAAMFGYGTPIGSHFAPHNATYVDLTGMYAYNPAKAKALLKEAGHENLELSLKLPPVGYARDGGQVIADMLSQVGVTAKIENVEWPVWLDQVFRGKQFDLTIVSHVEPMDVNNYTNAEYYWQYDSPEFRDIYSKFEASTTPADQKKWIQAAQTKIAEDAVNGFLFELAKLSVAKKGLTGMWASWPAFINEVAALSWEN